MSRPDSKVRWMTGLPVGLAVFSLSLATSHGQTTPATAAPASSADSRQSAYRSSIAQETVRKDADKIQVELVRLVAELKLNGLENGSLTLLTQASTHLSGMSQEDMQKVINSLQSASISADDVKRNQSLLSAYQGQQALVLKLKGLANSLTSQQAGNQLMNQLEGLITRQAANIRQTSVLSNGGHNADQLSDTEKNIHGIATTEQTAIAGQIDLLVGTLNSATSQKPSGPDATYDASKAVLDAINNSLLRDSAKLATNFTDKGPFPMAVGKQNTVMKYLVGLLKVASSKAGAMAKLTAAKNQLDQVKADQKDLNNATKNSKIDAATLAQRQAAINDRAEVAKALLAPLNPDAAKQVDAAQKNMQQSADALNKPQQNPASTPDAAAQQNATAKQDAAAKQDDAEKALADAGKQLDQQVADVQKQQAASPTEQMAQLQKAQDEIKQAQTDQQVSPQQAAQDAQKAQQDALAQAPDAADKLADAAAQLNQEAQQSQQNQQGQQPQAGQQPPQAGQQAQDSQQGQQQNQTAQQNADAAAQALAQAAQAIQAQKDALAQAAQDYQALAQASQALDQAAKDTADADQGLQKGTGKDLSDPAHKLSDAQAQVGQITQAPPQDLPADAKDAIAKAMDALKGSSIKAVQSDRKGADDKAKEALDALNQAKDSVGQAMAAVQAKSQEQQGKGPADAKDDQKGLADANGQMGSQQNDPKNSKGLIKGSYGAKTTNGSALVMGGLSPKDRDAITQYQAEKTPPEYTGLVQQYLKNLAESSNSH